MLSRQLNLPSIGDEHIIMSLGHTLSGAITLMVELFLRRFIAAFVLNSGTS